MHTKSRARRGCIASYVGPRAVAPRTHAALRGLGYSVVPAFATGRFDDASWRPALRLVDERLYPKVPSQENDPDTPIILLTGSRPSEIEDPRIIGHVSRPVELREIYPLIQRAVEDTPRRAPRAETVIAARCIRADRRWVGSVTSLSEGGCLFRCGQKIQSGLAMNLQFALPRAAMLALRAVCVRHQAGAAALVFDEPSFDVRYRINGFVTERLATY